MIHAMISTTVQMSFLSSFGALGRGSFWKWNCWSEGSDGETPGEFGASTWALQVNEMMGSSYRPIIRREVEVRPDPPLCP